MTLPSDMKSRKMKKSIACRSFFCLLLAILLLSGCAGPAASNVTDAPQETAPVESSATPARYAADYALLWDTLEHDYPYLDYLRGKGIDVDGIRAKYEEKMKKAQTSEDMVDVLEGIFYELRNTAHLSLIRQEDFPFYYSVYTAEESISIRLSSYNAVMQAAQTGYYKLPAEDSPQEADDYYQPREVEIQYFPDCKALCFTIFSFIQGVDKKVQDDIINAIKEYPEAEHIVFDIAMNGGGSEMYWVQNLVAPFGEDYYFPMRMYSKDTPLNRQILESRGGYRRTAELQDAPAWAEELGLELFHKDSIIVMGWPGIRSSAKRWVLVGPGVYSAAENFVNFCQRSGWATVAGTHTSGDGIGIDPVLVLLPDSGLLFRFSMVAGEKPDGGMSIEGSEPDLILPGSDLSDMLDYLREANKD